MSALDLNDEIDSARHLANAIIMMASGMGRSEQTSALAEVALVIDRKLTAVSEAMDKQRRAA